MGKIATPTESLEAAVEEALSPRDPRSSLAKGSLRYVKTLALSIGIQGPTAGVIIGPAIIASIVGGPGSLAQVLALVTMAFVAYAFIVFARSFNTAGSVYAFNGTAMGPGYGFVSTWILLLVYLSFAAGVYAATADIAQTFFASIGLNAPWFLFGIVGAVLAIGLAYLSIGISNIIIFACEGLSIVLISLVGISVLEKGGYHHHALNAQSFSSHGVGVGVLALGVVAAFGQFSGFEGAATLGEESKSSTRTIPVAIAGSLVISAAIYIFFTWISYNAYPSVKALANDPAPLVHIAGIYLDPLAAKTVNVAGTISAFGAQLACINAAARLLFALGRETKGIASLGFLAKTSSKFRSPTGALAVVAISTIAALVAFSFEATANRAAALVIQYGAYLILVAYLLTVVAAMAFVIKTTRKIFPILVLSIGVVVIGYVLYKTFVPFPTAPFNWVVLSGLGSVALGVVLYLIRPIRIALSNSELLKVITTKLKEI